MADKFLDSAGLQYLWGRLKQKLVRIDQDELPDFIEKEFATYDVSNSRACGNSFPGMQTSRVMLPLSASPGFTGGNNDLIYFSSSSGNTDREHYEVYQIYEGSVGAEEYDEEIVYTNLYPTVIDGIEPSGVESCELFVKQDPIFGNWWLTDTISTITAADLGINLSAAQASTDGRTSGHIWVTGGTLDSSKPNDLSGFWNNGGVMHWRYNSSSAYDTGTTGDTATVLRRRVSEFPNYFSIENKRGTYEWNWDGTSMSFDNGS